MAFHQVGVARRDELLRQFTTAPGQTKTFHCEMEFVISPNHLGEGPVGSPAGAVVVVPNIPSFGKDSRCAHGVLLHIPRAMCQQWLLALYGHSSLMYLLDFALAPSGREKRLPGASMRPALTRPTDSGVAVAGGGEDRLFPHEPKLSV
ncbi:hypothetical protein llap_10802 [Limosa lapponica baueri]|uniref:Uncharacterized protein n=1 Tax=Limosa lapponica baueri TaxID=1758121 RepID=A0A2I0TYK7_LIMLA|nr:hypothetical protein llap_10802 [Limosa lapponica baueri]